MIFFYAVHNCLNPCIGPVTYVVQDVVLPSTKDVLKHSSKASSVNFSSFYASGANPIFW